MAIISTSDFQKGIFINFRMTPHQIVDFTFVNPGKGSAFIRTKLKNLINGKVTEFTFKSGEKVEEILMEVHESQFLYRHDDNHIFMDIRDYDQFSVSKEALGDYTNYLKEGEIYQVIVKEGKGVTIRFPKKVRLKVVESQEAIAGDTVMGAKKTVTLETGVKVNVPLFIKPGDLVAIDPETGSYLERASS